MKNFSKENFIALIRGLFPNKKVLDKLSETSDGILVYDGIGMTDTAVSQKTGNLLQKRSDGLYAQDKAGNLASLLTNNKGTLVEALNEVFLSGSDFKKALSNAITAKDPKVVITNPEKANLQDFINAIDKIENGFDTSEATAVAADLLEDKTAFNASGSFKGTMKNVASGLTAPVSRVDSSYLYMGMAKGAHIQTGASGYPEVKMYFSTLASQLGIAAQKIVVGNTICGVTGTATNISFASGSCYVSMNLKSTSKIDAYRTTSISVNLPFTPKKVFLYGYASIHENPNHTGWVRSAEGYAFYDTQTGINHRVQCHVDSNEDGYPCTYRDTYFKITSFSKTTINIAMDSYASYESNTSTTIYTNHGSVYISNWIAIG